MSVENISKLHFEFNFTKMLILNDQEVQKIQEIYEDIINDRIVIKSLRKMIYGGNKPIIYFNNWENLDKNKKIELFLEKN